MSSQNLSTFNKADIGDCSHLKIGIVYSNWNSDITDNLYDGAFSTLIELGINKENITSFKVPGSFELVYGANKMSKKNVDQNQQYHQLINLQYQIPPHSL